MRARQFLALAAPMVVQQDDGTPVVLLAFIVGLFGRVSGLVTAPDVPSRPRTIPLDRITFPAAVMTRQVASMGGKMGAGPTTVGSLNREQRREAARRSDA